MIVVNDIATCLRQRGVSMSDAARVVGMSQINFYKTYAHTATPRNSAGWNKVRKVLHNDYGIGYDSTNGWHLLSDEEITTKYKTPAELQSDAMLERMNRKAAERRGDNHE